MRRLRKRPPRSRAAASALPLAAAAIAVLLTACGGSGGSEIADILSRAERAGESIESYRMSISMHVTGEGADDLQSEELALEVNGNDVHLRDTFFDPESGEGTVIQEVVRAGNRQWRKDISSGQWAEEDPVLSGEATSAYASHIGDFLANSDSASVLGEEEVNGVRAVRLRFELSRENVTALLPEAPGFSLEGCEGGQADIWVDAAASFPVRYELLYRNVMVGQGMQNADVRIVIDITDINGPVEITAPV